MYINISEILQRSPFGAFFMTISEQVSEKCIDAQNNQRNAWNFGKPAILCELHTKSGSEVNENHEQGESSENNTD